MLHSFPFYIIAMVSCFYFESKARFCNPSISLENTGQGRGLWIQHGENCCVGAPSLRSHPGLTFQNSRHRLESSILPSPSPSADPRPPGLHSRLREWHVMGVLGEEVSRRQVLSKCLQAGVISPGEEANSHGSGSEEGFHLLTQRLDFEIRRAGEELGEESWSGY